MLRQQRTGCQEEDNDIKFTGNYAIAPHPYRAYLVVSENISSSHRYLFLENLLPNCKVLNINTPQKRKQPKETNWKQKFQKPQNENICLTSVNTEMNGNFPILSFGMSFKEGVE